MAIPAKLKPRLVRWQGVHGAPLSVPHPGPDGRDCRAPYDHAVISKAQYSPSRMPPAVQRLGWWFLPQIIFVFAFPIAYRIPAVHKAIGAPTPWIWAGMPVLVLAPSAVMIVGVWRGLRRIRSAVKAASGRACTSCLYNLGGLGDAGLCPECGRLFDTAADRRSWVGAKMIA